MRVPNNSLTNKNPLVISPFIQHWSDSDINPPPPGSSLMITEDGSSYMVTENGNYMITE